MFNIGDLIIYSEQGICHIDEICEKTFMGVTRKYYVLHPIDNCRLEISIPVDSDKVMMLELIQREEAEEIIESFKLPGLDWIEINTFRMQTYSGIVKQGDRKEISKIANTLMVKKHQCEALGKKFYEQDNRLLISIQNILFAELAMALNTTSEEINERITAMIAEKERN